MSEVEFGDNPKQYNISNYSGSSGVTNATLDSCDLE